ncbi:MAG: hypothetical protein KIT87_09585 [Anaerolineae bacterium]|nr:hypothetical protein [Anaerolineae bacterium]
MRRWLFVSSLALLMVVLVGVGLVEAQSGGPAQIQVDPMDTDLVITGWLGEDNSFIGNMRLTALGGKIDRFTFLSSDLKQKDGQEKLGRQNVSLVGDPTLDVGIPKDFQVKVIGLRLPGTYTGTLTLIVPGPTPQLTSVHLTVNAKARPAMTALAGTDRVQLRLVNCRRTLLSITWSVPLVNWPQQTDIPDLNCWLARVLLSDSALLDSLPLNFDNTTLDKVKLLSANAVVLDDRTRAPLSDQALKLPTPQQEYGIASIVSTPLSIQREAIPPGHYTGSVYLTVADRPERIAVPVDLSVRSGPLWPLLALLVGIILGRLFRYMQTKGAAQADALAALYRIEARLDDAEPADRRFLADQAADVRRLIDEGNLDAAAAERQTLEKRVEVLHTLSQIQEEPIAQAESTLSVIEEVRLLIRLGQDEQAQKKMADLTAALVNPPRDQLPEGLRDFIPPQAADRAKRLADTAAETLARPTLRVGAPPVSAGQRLARAFSSLESFRTDLLLWVGRPLLYLTLLLGLLAVGLSSLYIDKGATFGANPLADYTTLLIWGLSADVASRTLSTLGGTPTSPTPPV